MFEFLVYLAQSAVCLATLYLIYKVAMSYETLHSFNRMLLLGSVVLSALLPLCHVRILKEYDAAPTVSAIEIDDMVVAEVAELGVDYVALLKDLAVMLFFVGVAFMLVRMAVGIYSVWRLIHSGQMSVIEEDVTLTVVDSLSSPFSWFGHIVASEEDVRQYRDMILSHELAHISLRHSLDVLAVDLALCLWWFNPALWLLRRELQSLHEYQADEAVLNRGVDAKTYQMLLIKRAVGSRLHSVANCLNHSNLKNRITMMCKNQSSRWAATKALLVVPMVAVALSAFATTEYVPREVQNKVTENSANLQDEEKPNRVVVVNGEKIYYDEMSKIDPNTIHSVNVYKDYSKLPKELKISEDEAKNGVIVITLKKDGDTAVSAEVTKGNIVIVDKSSAKKVSLREALQMNLRPVEGLYGVAKAEVTVNPDGSFDKVNINCSNKEEDEDLTPLVNEVSRALHSAIKRAELPAKKTKYNFDISFCIKTDDGVLSSKVPVGDDVIVVMAYAEKKNSQQDDKPYIKVEKMPTFQGGDLNRFAVWMQSQIQYPAEAVKKGISGRVIFSFVVEKDGSMSDFTVLASPDKLLSDEVERVFNSAPKAWTAGEEKGQKVRVKFTVPIVFAHVSNAPENVSGQVIDAEGKPFMGVIVQVDGSDARGVVTDVEGRFSIPMSKGETLKFSYIGMETKQVKVNNTDKPLSVTMK